MSNIFKQFLESSTIHGLVYISTESKLARITWLLIVITGFTVASLMINDAFDDWFKNPIKTTTETRKMSKLKLAKLVTLFPSKDWL